MIAGGTECSRDDGQLQGHERGDGRQHPDQRRGDSGARTRTGGQAGVMIRQSSDPGSPYYAVLAEPGDTLSVQYRTAFDGPTTVATTTTDAGLPLYLMVQRVGDTLQAATSENGSFWTLVPGSNASVAMPAVSLAGLAVSSGTNGTAATASFSALSIGTPTLPRLSRRRRLRPLPLGLELPGHRQPGPGR